MSSDELAEGIAAIFDNPLRQAVWVIEQRNGMGQSWAHTEPNGNGTALPLGDHENLSAIP
jgi:hypothetical protein